MSNLIDNLKLIIIEKNSKIPIPNIIVKLKLFSNHKNNYNFILPISDENGCIEISRDWLKQEIEKEKNYLKWIMLLI